MNVLIFDTETTGLKEDSEIIEAAYLLLKPDAGLFGPEPDRIPPLLVVDTLFCQRYKPARTMSTGSIAVHHILPEELEGAPDSATFALPEDADYIVGHSVDFDWKAAGSPTHVKRLCTFAMSEHVWPDADSHSLVGLTYMLHGTVPSTRAMVQNAHGAATDVVLTKLLLREILRKRPEIITWSGLHAFSEECRIPLFSPLKRWDGIKLEDMDDSSINWCLRQDWLDPYFRKGLVRVLDARYPIMERTA